MPTLKVVDGAKIQMFHEDHPPPHFHIYKGGVSFRFFINSYTQLTNDGVAAPREIRQIAKLVGLQHGDQLMGAWDACRRGEQPDPLH
jgi:hypothetical protein